MLYMFTELTPIYDAETDQAALSSQQEFDTCISKRPLNEKNYIIPFACEGVIDMQIFDTEGRTPYSVKFKEGKISHLINIPASLKELVVDNNILEQVPDGAQQLTIFQCNNNNIKRAPTKEFQNLVKLSMDGNKLETIENLPPNLEWLSIANNPNLAYVDLGAPRNCNYVNCQENSNLKQIVNVCQAANNGFQLLAPPETKIIYIDEEAGAQTGGAKKKQDEEDAMAQTMDAYYALKAEYERDRQKKVREIAGNRRYSSIKEKRKMLRKLPRKCLKCGKPGNGMRFWRDNDMLHAECAAQPKCNFSLSVSAGFYANIHYLLNVTAQDMSDKRANIIRLKMDTLFNYITETASKNAFKKELETYQGNEAMYNTYKDYETLLTADPVKTRLIKKKTAEIWKLMKEVRVMVDVYKKTGDKRMLREAVEKQMNELFPEVAAVRTMKHPVMKMVTLDDGTHNLVQNAYSYEAADYKLIG